jgi:sporulation protein YlmC with PRC-barrel domain
MTRTRLLCAAVVLGWTAIASAQTDKPQSKTPPSSTPPTVSKQDLKKGVPFCHKASEVIGSKVKNPQGEDLGKVEELVVEPASGSIEYAVVSFGGFLGMGDKLFAVPFSLLKAPDVPEGDRLAHFTLNVDKARMEKAPGFDKNNWPDVSAPNWGDEIHRYYGTSPSHKMGDELTPPGSGKGDMGKDAGKAIDENRNYRLVKASDLMGKKIENPSNDNLGDIKELILDPGRSRISYFVMKSGGFLGMGDKLFAIPWQALKVERQENKDKLVLNATKERFEKAPEYKDSDWRRMSDPSWVEEVYGYYSVRPYWKSGSTGAGMPIDR